MCAAWEATGLRYARASPLCKRVGGIMALVYYTTRAVSRAQAAMSALRSAGHQVTYDWTMYCRQDDPYSFAAYAHQMLSGILTADAFIIEDGGETSLVELGYALAYTPRVYLVRVPPSLYP